MNILWDFDGTICNTYPAYAKLLYQFINERESYDEVFQRLKVSFSHAYEYFNLTSNEIADFKRQDEQLDVTQLPPFPNIEDVLKLADKNVIMTHKDRATVVKVLNHYDLAHYFSEIVTTENGYPRKPDPTSYEYLHRKYNLTLAIGDRELDLLPAKKVGFSTCMFQGKCDAADFSINDYSEFQKAWERFLENQLKNNRS